MDEKKLQIFLDFIKLFFTKIHFFFTNFQAKIFEQNNTDGMVRNHQIISIRF